METRTYGQVTFYISGNKAELEAKAAELGLTQDTEAKSLMSRILQYEDTSLHFRNADSKTRGTIRLWDCQRYCLQVSAD